jgi:hypothetical protein
MMPQVVSVRVRSERGRRLRLWAPVLPTLLVLTPLVLLALVASAVACLVNRINPIRMFYLAWRLLWALGGTRIEIEQGRTAVLVDIR